MAKKKNRKKPAQRTQQQSDLTRAEQLFSLGHFSEALPFFTRLLDQHPGNPDLLYYTGYTYYACKKYEQAAEALKQLLTFQPQHESGRMMLLAALNDGRMTEAMLSLAKKIKDNPLNEGEYLQAFTAFLAVCDWDNALPMLDRCVQSILHDHVPAPLLPGFLVESLGINGISCETMHALTTKAGEISTHHIKPLPAEPEQQIIRSRVKLAYLSSDFRTHPVGYFIYSILAAHNRHNFEVFCYSGSPDHDSVTASIQQVAEHFLDVSGLNEAEIADKIRQDGIHILVDLGGYTESSKLKTLSYRPAPVSIEYLGYANSTGNPNVDFRITDSYADTPEGTRYTETLLTMPGSFLCFGMQPSCTRSEQAPVVNNNFVTFGSFNNSRKLNPLVIETWSKILERVADSRLVLKGNWRQGYISKNILKVFNKYGIQSERITFLTPTKTYDEHVDCYNRIDIALDTFPYSGTTTTCEALWMGLPVVTLVGPAHQNRVSYSILKNIGFEETICHTVEEYVEKAVQLANNPDSLTVLRPMLHTLFSYSPITQPQVMVPQLEDLYLEACKQKGLTYQPHNPAAGATAGADSCVRKLHIGGKERHPEWEILDAIPSELTDHIGNANDLSAFADHTFEALYSSHVLEHFSYQGELPQVLSEWYRVIKPGGHIYISVPNLEVLCELFLNKAELPVQDRFMVMRMIFGGQMDSYDFHKVGYDLDILSHFVSQAGFRNIRTVPSFGLFNDTSVMEFAGRPISLNIIAEKAPPSSDKTWLCSYPKSGNTMLRIAVENYFNRPTESIYKDRTTGDNSPLFGDNYTDAIGIKCHKVGEIPDHATMVYIYRDPRDVLISYFKWNSGLLPAENETLFSEFMTNMLADWKGEIESARSFAGNKLLVRYEDIIRDPVTRYAQIFSFMQPDTEIDAEQLENTIKNTTKEKAFKWFEKLGANDNIMPMESKTTRWKEVMTESQIEQVTTILGSDLLTELGY